MPLRYAGTKQLTPFRQLNRALYGNLKSNVIASLFPKKWSSELVVNNIKSEQELSFIEAEGIKLIKLPYIIKQLNENDFKIQSASGADFVDLISFAPQNV